MTNMSISKYIRDFRILEQSCVLNCAQSAANFRVINQYFSNILVSFIRFSAISKIAEIRAFSEKNIEFYL